MYFKISFIGGWGKEGPWEKGASGKNLHQLPSKDDWVCFLEPLLNQVCGEERVPKLGESPLGPKGSGRGGGHEAECKSQPRKVKCFITSLNRGQRLKVSPIYNEQEPAAGGGGGAGRQKCWKRGEGSRNTNKFCYCLKTFGKVVSNTLFPHHLTFLRKEAFFLQLDL